MAKEPRRRKYRSKKVCRERSGRDFKTRYTPKSEADAANGAKSPCSAVLLSYCELDVYAVTWHCAYMGGQGLKGHCSEDKSGGHAWRGATHLLDGELLPHASCQTLMSTNVDCADSERREVEQRAGIELLRPGDRSSYEDGSQNQVCALSIPRVFPAPLWLFQHFDPALRLCVSDGLLQERCAVLWAPAARCSCLHCSWLAGLELLSCPALSPTRLGAQFQKHRSM